MKKLKKLKRALAMVLFSMSLPIPVLGMVFISSGVGKFLFGYSADPRSLFEFGVYVGGVLAVGVMVVLVAESVSNYYDD